MVLTLMVLGAILVVLVRELAAPAPTMLGGVVVLVVVDVVPPEVAFAGFSSPATVTIAGLFVLARALQVHGGLTGALVAVLGSRGSAARDGGPTRGSDRWTLGRLVASVLGASAVVANTPLVATLGPMVRTWSEREGRPASTFLMPLSFAAILGGVVTTIGTSTTLVVSGLVDQAGLGSLGLLEVLPVGLPVALVGGALLVALAPRVLPDRRSSYAQVASHERDYTFRLQVEPDGPLMGRTITASGLRNLDDVYLAGLHRGDLDLAPLSPSTVLQAGDVLSFVGRVDRVLDVAGREGLTHADETQATLLEGDGHRLVEAVVGTNSPLVGRTPKEMSFRGHYGAAIVAIHRQGQRVDAKLGEVRLQAGDALLLLTDVDFEERWRPTHDFAIVVPLAHADDVGTSRRGLVLGVLAAMVVAAAVGVPILVAVLGACLVLVATRTIRFWDARASVDLDVLLIVATAIGLGGAVASSGLADRVARGIEVVADGGGPVLALLAVLVGTLVLTELVTNVAAAALMVPVALDVAVRVGADPRGWAIGVAVMASCSFLTPIGYQTNTIVYGLGGYRFSDYWRLGLPLTLLALAVTATLVPVVWG